LVMVSDPAPGVMLIPLPAVNVAATGAAPVDPIKSWPSANTFESKPMPDELLTWTPLAVTVVFMEFLTLIF
jgi:hypothetical protein